jgi:2'-5' RNA ligase
METIRSFIAIELPEEIRVELSKLQNALKTKEQNYMKWVSIESIHLTLKFLGDITSDKSGEILEAMAESIVGIPYFSLRIQELGVFPNLKRIQVVWVGINGEIDKLRQIQGHLEENLAILGYPAEEREFTPHLTLGRTRFQPPPAFAERLSATKFESKTKIEVKSINLIRSQLTPTGAIYSRLGSVNLKSLS